MSNLAYYSTFYDLLGKLYSVAHNLDADSNYSRQDAIDDILRVILMMEKDNNIFQKEGE